ncbi:MULTISPECIES: hypothetical protein [Halococcus]|uniref:Thiolase n=1 Tax=Halococcus salifodinae DSM 8989 TaxID=1227456 RepID=M0MX85_9EURY|nr:thiolase [Halococcus salifodinae DSM 8989]
MERYGTVDQRSHRLGATASWSRYARCLPRRCGPVAVRLLSRQKLPFAVATADDRALDSVDGELDPNRIDEAFLGTLGVGGRQIGLSAPAVTDRGLL